MHASFVLCGIHCFDDPVASFFYYNDKRLCTNNSQKVNNNVQQDSALKQHTSFHHT